jgi:hypothetical protein
MGVSEAELEAVFKQELLEQLERDRKMLMEAKLRAGTPGVSIPQTRIIGPNGNPIV